MQGLKFVPMEADETGFVVDSWVRSFRDSPWAGVISNDQYQEVYRTAVNALLVRGTKVTVAIPEMGPRRVLGYVASEFDDIIHYVYVKRFARNKGLASALVSHVAPSGGLFTFRTPAAEFLLRRNFSWTPVPARVVTWRPHET